MFEQLNTTDFLIILGALVFLYLLMYPQFQMRAARRKRLSKIRDMEEKWGTKVLTMIHRKEAISMLGLSVYQYIDVEDAEEVLRGIREAKDKPIDLIIHTPGTASCLGADSKSIEESQIQDPGFHSSLFHVGRDDHRPCGK